MAPIPANSVIETRVKTGLNQTKFWAIIGVTQSGGSRFEGGRQMPRSTRALFRIFFLWGITPEALDVLRKHVKKEKERENAVLKTINKVLVSRKRKKTGS
jgi:hypothetical protein